MYLILATDRRFEHRISSVRVWFQEAPRNARYIVGHKPTAEYAICKRALQKNQGRCSRPDWADAYKNYVIQVMACGGLWPMGSKRPTTTINPDVQQNKKAALSHFVHEVWLLTVEREVVETNRMEETKNKRIPSGPQWKNSWWSGSGDGGIGLDSLC